ncbi:FtsX-like permease family protein [Ornithinibacillus bavariensis]|uniref:ABC transporter permease n=1 Tax=Ornithinibacillus bavariensis TaxID=545502 RepID=A0A919XAV9_9BACI|nr:ABC transporter permease [Ornithinibacillus bavariensis]GIO28043.1 ABC transporter permease [Ornithinibacillus bavariensis]
MTLFRIARKNIRKNFTNYFLYVASMIFSIVIYFTFVSLKYDEAITAATESSQKISSVFNAASVVLIIFVAIFIWYSNSFFTRKRKKEIGLYSLLGVRKKQIGRLLFYENFLMGIIALFIGVLLGSVLSKFFVTILMKVMGYDVIATFAISTNAIINTIIIFILIIAITSIYGYRLIFRFKLIDLFQADKEGEKEPKASFFIAVLALIFIGIGYWLALQNILESEAWRKIGIMVTPLVIILSVILGTYLLFNTLIVYLLKLTKKNKRRFWKGINIISTSQLLYRIKGNARTLTIISILSATTLTAVGASYSLYYNNKGNAELANPNSIMFIQQDEHLANKVNDKILQEEKHQIIYHKTIPTMQIRVDTSSLNNLMGESIQEYTFISTKTFNEMAGLQGRKDRLSLEGNHAAILDAGYYEGLSPEYVGSSLSLHVDSIAEDITFKKLLKYNVLNTKTANITVVIGDDLFSKLEKETALVNMEAYKITNENNAKEINEVIESILPDDASFSSFYNDYSLGMETSGLIIFIGAFLGLVFLAATGSIIYFKQLTEANSDKGRYNILHKIGVNKREVRKSIAKQVFFIFALPLFVGIAHSAVALTALSRLMQTNLLIPVFICIGIYMLIYVIYYFLTVRTYYKIVTK